MERGSRSCRDHPALGVMLVVVMGITLSHANAGHAQCTVSTSPCTGSKSVCGEWWQIPTCCPEYTNCAAAGGGWPCGLSTHMALLKGGDGKGRVLLWHGTPTGQGGHMGDYWRPTWNASAPGGNGVPRRIYGTLPGDVQYDLFCSGHVVLDDGTLMTAGGNVPGSCTDPSQGIKPSYVFDPASSDTCGMLAIPSGAPTVNWCGETVERGWRQRGAESAFERWYPTCTVLANGKVLVTSGGTCGQVTAVTPEVYDRFSTGLFTLLSSASSQRYGTPWYPHMHLVNSGKVLHVGPHVSVDDPSTGSPAAMQTLKATSLESWQNFGTTAVRGGSAVMYTTGDPATSGPAMILKTGGYASGASGGSGGVVGEIEIVREDGTNTVCQPMGVPRLQQNLTVLPNGKVLITGGTCGTDILANAVYATELWDPTASCATAAPVRLADAPQGPPAPPPPPQQPPGSQHRARTYHSTALLLPDGRVISAGGETCTQLDPQGRCPQANQVDSDNADYFYPPYLFNGNSLIQDSDRPRITAGLPQPPQSLLIATGSTFTVTASSGSGSSIQKACLIRPSAVTHAFNQEQRYVPLPFTPTTGGTLQRTVTAPVKAETAPPGYYLLFFLNDLGYPSIGEFVRVWGIVENSIVHSNLQALPGNVLSLQIAWDTSIPANDIDRVLLFRKATPTAPFDPPITLSCTAPACRSDFDRRHANTWTWPCDGGYWYYQVQSSESNTTSTNAAKIFIAKVMYCLD